MTRFARALGIRPGEGPVGWRLIVLMLALGAGIAVGGSAIESLFFSRFGVRFLPYMFLALGPITFVTMMFTAAAVGRSARAVILLPLGLAILVAAGRGLLLIEARWIYPALWLLELVAWTVQGIAAWGLAGAVHDTRQSKRLFPLYGAALIAGGVIGGLLTPVLAGVLGVENLLLFWASLLMGGFLAARSVALRAGLRGSTRRVAGRRRPGPFASLRTGRVSIRGSALLRWMAIAFMLFAFLYFALSLPFARVVTSRFPDPEQLAGFLGTFFGVTNGAALLISLMVANRLFARFGIGSMVLVLPVIYLVGFGALITGASFGAVVVFRFLQLVWVSGVWLTGWQALYGVVPPGRRAAVRIAMEAVPWQVGVVLAGAGLILAGRLGGPTAVYPLGAVAAIVAGYAAVRARRAYADALEGALREGWPEVFVAEDQPFGGFRRDAAAIAALTRGLADPRARVRRTALEIIHTFAPEDLPDEARPAIVRLLGDRDRDIRLAAVVALKGDAGNTDLARTLRPVLDDADAAVRAQAAAVLTRSGDPGARERLAAMAASDDPTQRSHAIRAVAETGGHEELVVGALRDADPDVRRAAATALADVPPDMGLAPLIEAMHDEDRGVGRAVEDSLVRIGERAAPALLGLLADPTLEDAALRVLEAMGAHPSAGLEAYVKEKSERARGRHRSWRAVASRKDPAGSMLADSLRHEALRHGRRALRAASAMRGSAAVRLAIENLDSRDLEQRANAVEMIEASALVEPQLLAIWEPVAGDRGDREALATLMADDDPWVRACAALAASNGDDPSAIAALERLASDPDPLVRETAARAIRRDVGAMETVPTIALMDRILCLRGVPLFAELPPEDLKHIAEAATEEQHADGTVLAEQGELGEELYVVTAGEVEVRVARGDRVVVAARRRPGEYAGEMSLISGEPRMATLVAAGDVRVLTLDRKRFERIMAERPTVGLAVMRELCNRLRQASASDPVEARV